VGGELLAAQCPCCGVCFTTTRQPARRRIAQFLIRSVSYYSHPDDIVFVPWLPF